MQTVKISRESIAMKASPTDFYSEAHLFVAAIRVHEHVHSQPATLEDLCRMLSFSAEHAGFISRRLEDLGIVEAVNGSFGTRFFIQDHRRLEDIPRGEVGRKLEDEVKKFQDSQRSIAQRIESIKAEQAGKKKNLFAEMEKKLKEELDKKTRSRP
jgi:DNA-binding IscR family transcriptional regulator